MNKKTTPHKDVLTIPCPSCGCKIPIAEAVAHAVAERTSKIEKASTDERSHWDQQIKQLKQEAERQQKELATGLAEEHARELSAIRAKAERAQQILLKRLREESDAKSTQVVHAHELVQHNQAELLGLKNELISLQSNLSGAVVESRESFEKGRKSGMTELQKHLDEIQAEMAEREVLHSTRLAEAIRKAQKQASADEQKRQKSQFDAALKFERERIFSDAARKQFVTHQRYENELVTLRKEIEALHQKAEVNPSDATGQAAEDVLERQLKEAFQIEGDTITRTKKGQRGADVLLTILRAGGRSILLESKWTQSFDPGWIAKAQKDRRAAGAEVVIIVSRALPAGIEHLAMVQDVWVASHGTVLALVTALRHGLLSIERASRAHSLDEAKVLELKKYLSGPQFREQVELIVRLTADQSEGLLRERAQHERSWTQTKEAQDRILVSAVGIWTALELHSGSSLQPSEVLKPFLTPQEPIATGPKKRKQAA